MQHLPNGRYTLGIRPHCISPVRNGGAAVEIEGQVQITELSGAESVIHFAHGPLSWISQSHGVHAMRSARRPGSTWMSSNACTSMPTEGWSRHEPGRRDRDSAHAHRSYAVRLVRSLPVP